MVRKKPTLKEQLGNYSGASLVQYAFTEAPAILSIIALFITGNLLYPTITLLLLAYFITLRPTKSKISNDLQLQGALLGQFNKGDEALQ